MFLSNSRYAKVPQVSITLPDGTTALAVQLRILPVTDGTPTTVTSNDRLDVIADRRYGDATQFWRIADANTELEANRLLKPWLPEDPNATPMSINVPEK